MTTNYYKELYDKMYDNALIKGKDVHIMKLWGEHEKMFIHKLLDSGSEHAKSYILNLESAIESSHWNNYISKIELDKIMSHLSPSGKWKCEDVKEFTEKHGLFHENKPMWNFYSLVVTMNMLHSDFHKTIQPLVCTEEEYCSVIYKLAINKLEDYDRPNFIRNYFSEAIAM